VKGQRLERTGRNRARAPTSHPKPPLLTLPQQLEALAKKQQLALQQQLNLQQQQQQQLDTSEADSLEIARAQIKQLEARLAVDGHILKGHLQRERSEAAEKEARQGEQRMPASLDIARQPRLRFSLRKLGEERLVHAGRPLCPAITALDNNFSVQRAHAHLLALASQGNQPSAGKSSRRPR